ncbi:MAG: uracil-DNA glycosylase [Lachnospiraceae bacterium]|nr:uracil-DNA glycosylase [Lachnospiraceae bacterium]
MIDNDWLPVLKPEFSKPYYRELYKKVNEEYRTATVYPGGAELFSAFSLTPLSKVKVVIIGQDPYHEPGQAHGLCFSVKPGVDIPPSLYNIYKELNAEYGYEIPDNGYLVPWAEQGVLLLNTVLTVRAHTAFSHRGIGWEQFTDAAIRAVNEIDRPVVFMLWGRPAGEKAAMLNNPKHLVLKCAHPSPLSASRGFFGCGHFRMCNEFLINNGLSPINWRIPNLGAVNEFYRNT